LRYMRKYLRVEEDLDMEEDQLERANAADETFPSETVQNRHPAGIAIVQSRPELDRA